MLFVKDGFNKNMNEKKDAVTNENGLFDARRDTSVGTGKKVGLYGCGFMILAIVLIAVVLILTGIYNPFQGTEGVGP